ncbi:N-acetyltransferase Eis [subsurface metagenome]
MNEEVIIRPYHVKKDGEVVLSVFEEAGWREKEKKQDRAWRLYLKSVQSWVAVVDGRAESVATTVPGTLRYLTEDLAFCAVTAVVTSRTARKQGLASRVTARALAEAAADGALVAGLGVFDQGFYNRLSFGSGSYEYWVTLDPARLMVDKIARMPKRITRDDWRAVHACRLSRTRQHGSCSLTLPVTSRAEMLWIKNGFGLGFYEGNELTHHLWASSEGEEGPYTVHWLAYRNYTQLLELLSLVKGFADQIMVVKMVEPPGIQIQDLLDRPFRQRSISKAARHEYNICALAYWQMRILDLAACVRSVQISGESVEFNLDLHDPIEQYLDRNVLWKGIAGQYIVRLGQQSKCEQGSKRGLPTLNVDVGAFTRLWLGVRSASSLAATDNLSGPAELLLSLDEVFNLPTPKPDWDF